MTRAEIRWLGDCEYELRYIPDPTGLNKKDSFMAAGPLKITILKTSQNYCIFQSTMEGMNLVFTDTLQKLE